MTYCLGIKTHEGLVMASDSRANAGYDQVNICRKMHTFAKQGERVFVCATEESPYLQLGEVKYGRPILDRGIDARKTTLESASKYAMLSFDATMRSNATVGPPIELLQYRNDSLSFDQYRRFGAHDSELDLIHMRWEQALRRVVDDLPSIQFAGTVEDSFAGTVEDSNSLQAMTFESGRLPIP